MIYVTISELADICGFTEATATNYYYLKLLPKPAYIEKKSRGRKVAWWLIDDVMVCWKSSAKPQGYKDVPVDRLRELTEQQVKRSEMAEILGFPLHIISDACVKNGIKSQINTGRKPVKKEARDLTVEAINKFLKTQLKGK